MSTTHVVAKNTFLLTLGILVGRLLSVLVLKKMTPILGPGGLGIWGLATDLTTILLTLANFGLGVLVIREVTRAKAMTLPILWAVLRIRWFMGVLCYLFLLLYVHLAGLAPMAQAAVLITGIAVFVEATSMACDSILQAHEKVQYQTYGQLVSAVVYFGLAFWSLDAGYGLMGVIWANLLSRVARLAVMVPLMLTKTGPWRWSISRTDVGASPYTIRWMMKLGLPLFLSTTFGIVYYKVDVVMLMSFVGEAATGIYILGHRALDVLMMGPNIFATALFPAMARYGVSDQEDAARLGERALRYMMLATLPLTLFFMLTADPVISWFDKKGEFPDSIPVLQIVIWGLPFQAANTIFNRLLVTARREKVFVNIALVSMLVNVALNLFLIPRYSYFGAAVATIAGLATSCVMHYAYLTRTNLRVPLGRAIPGSVLALAMSWLATVGIVRLVAPDWNRGWAVLPVDAGWGPFLAVTAIAVVLYIVALFGLRVFRRDDLHLLSLLVKPTRE